MALLLAPYNPAMRIGQGFNSYTQEIRVNDAVVVNDKAAGGDHYVKGSEQQISQIVSYCSRHVSKLSQVTDAMNLSASLSIKSGTIGGASGGSFIDADKFKESDINYFIQVQVTNQVVMSEDVTQYVPFENAEHINGKTFTRVYGDTFISGFIEGGEFDALISIKMNDNATDDDMDDVRRALEAVFGQGMSALPDTTVVDPRLRKALDPYLTAETTITVNWNGGGQLKDPNALWNIHTVAAAAATFPERVSHTPQRTYAILSKYTTLRSYHMFGPTEGTLNYENAGIYTNMLLDLYMDYKNIFTKIHLMSIGYEFQRGRLEKSDFDIAKEIPMREKAAKPANIELVSALADLDATAAADVHAKVDDYLRRLLITSSPESSATDIRLFEPTVHGLDQARLACRANMVELVKEVDQIIDDPKLADDPYKKPSCLNPAIFRRLLPNYIEEEDMIGETADAGVRGLPKSIYPFIKKGSKKMIPGWLSKWAGSKAVDRNKARQFSFSEYFGEHAPRSPNLAFEDFTLVQDESLIESITVWCSDDRITGITTTYKGGAGQSHPVSPQGNKSTFSVPADQRIIALNVHGKIVDGKMRVTSLKIGTDDFDGGKRIGIDNDDSPAELFTVTPDSKWSCKGFWGVVDGQGIDQLGVIYGRDPEGKNKGEGQAPPPPPITQQPSGTDGRAPPPSDQ